MNPAMMNPDSERRARLGTPRARHLAPSTSACPLPAVMKAAQKMMSNMSPEYMNRMMEVGWPARSRARRRLPSHTRGAEAAARPDNRRAPW